MDKGFFKFILFVLQIISATNVVMSMWFTFISERVNNRLNINLKNGWVLYEDILECEVLYKDNNY